MNKQEIKELFVSTRRKSTELCTPLETEDFVVQPIEDVSPPKWHLGHTTWFFEKFILENFEPNYKPFHRSYNFLFNSYYETAGVRVVRATRGNLSRPTVKEIMAYRNNVDERMLELLSVSNDKKVWELTELGLHHENQHQELLLTDIKYILAVNPLLPVYNQNPGKQTKQEGTTAEMNFLGVDEGLYEVGYGGTKFHYDNEEASHQVFLQGFNILSRCISNQEYLEFMQDGGYQNFRLWLSEGWEWVKQNEVRAPLYWTENDSAWHYFTLNGLQPLDPSAPVTHISYFEADAFARWKGMRLPTEFEWEVACKKTNGSMKKANLLGRNYLHPVAPQEGNKQLIGDVWEWTSSAYLAYPGYEQPNGAIGEYNGKFMANQMVLRGGSCVTPDEHIRMTYRNFFQTDKRWQFTGFRLVK